MVTATATRKRKKAGQSKRPTKKAGQSGKFATNQPAIKGMEDTDERIPALDDECQRYFAAKDKQATAKHDEELAAEKIGKMLHEHKLDLYVLNGKSFTWNPA